MCITIMIHSCCTVVYASLESATYEVYEDQGAVEACIHVVGDLEARISIFIYTDSASASGKHHNMH